MEQAGHHMNDIRAILKLAGRRLEAASLLRCIQTAVIGLGILVIVLIAVERVSAAPFWPWRWLGPALAVPTLLVAAVMWSRRRRTSLQIAVEVDQRLDLREKLSTALHVADRDDPFARAAIEDAVSAARDPGTREQVRRRFTVQRPARAWITPLIAAVAVGVWFVPQDLFASDREQEVALAETLQQRDDAIQAVIKPILNSPELRDELSDLLGDLAQDAADPDALKTRQDVRRNAIKKLTDLNKRLDEIVNGPKGKTAEAIDKILDQLKTPQDGPGKELAEALAAGDFKAAQEALAKLARDIRDGNLTDEQKQQLARQMNDIAQQLQQLAQQQQQLQEALQQAGLDPQLAQNPQALREAIANNPNLNEQQKQQLQQMAQAQQAAGQMCQGLGQGLNQMAQGLMQGQMNPGGKLGEQLNELEALQQLLQQARAAAGACQGQVQGLGQGLGMQQAMKLWKQCQGGAFGNRGQGAGGKAPISPTPTGMKLVHSPSQTTPGDIIARQFIDGPVIVGESKATLKAVAAVVSEGFDEAQGDDLVPPKYREAHMHYFGELKKRIEAKQQSTADGESSEDPPTADDE